MTRLEKLTKLLFELEAGIRVLQDFGEKQSTINLAIKHSRVAQIIRKLKLRENLS